MGSMNPPVRCLSAVLAACLLLAACGTTTPAPVIAPGPSPQERLAAVHAVATATQGLVLAGDAVHDAGGDVLVTVA